MNETLVVASEHMTRLDMSYNTVSMMVMMVTIPSRYMMVTMANNYREMRSSHGGRDKEGEQESNNWNIHDLLNIFLDCEDSVLVLSFIVSSSNYQDFTTSEGRRTNRILKIPIIMIIEVLFIVPNAILLHL